MPQNKVLNIFYKDFSSQWLSLLLSLTSLMSNKNLVSLILCFHKADRSAWLGYLDMPPSVWLFGNKRSNSFSFISFFISSSKLFFSFGTCCFLLCPHLQAHINHLTLMSLELVTALQYSTPQSLPKKTNASVLPPDKSISGCFIFHQVSSSLMTLAAILDSKRPEEKQVFLGNDFKEFVGIACLVK